jgi:uncharacterized protein
MSRLRSLEGRQRRFVIPNLTDKNDIRRLTKGAPQSGRRDRPPRALRGRAGADDQRPATTLRRIAPQALPGQRDAWDADRLERYKGNPPKMVPMVVDPAAGGAASHASADAWDFFTGKKAPEEDKWRFKKWRNEITLRSLEMYSEYEPGAFIERIAPTPLLMVLGDADVVCPTDLALAAFNRAGEPKRLEPYPGGHFSAYTDQFDRAAKAATEWFTQHLRR